MNEFFRRLRYLLNRRRMDRELADEMEFHREMAEREGGTSPFGNPLRLREESRDTWGWTWIDRLFQDLRYAARTLWNSPRFTAAAVLTLALAIGANTAIFSLVNAVMLRQLAFKNPDQLVWIWSSRTDRDKSNFSLPDFIDYRDQNRTLDQISGFSTWSANLVNSGDPERVFGVRSSANIFQTLGVNAEIGRTLLSEDDDPGNPRVVVLSHGFWKRRFGMSTDIVGGSLTLNDENYVVAGVLPPDFAFPGMEADIVVPLVPDADPLRKERGSISFLGVVGRLKEGVTRQQAETDLSGIASHLQELYPVTNASKKGTILIPLHEALVGNLRLAFLTLSAAVGLLLLIACANLANLVLARASTRSREMAIRLAVGATKWRLVRQLLTENILLALMGGALGLVLTQPAMTSIIALSPASLPRASEVDIDARVLLFTLWISLLSGVLFGLMPTFQIARERFNEDLKGSGKGAPDGSRGNGIRSILILAEVAISLLLLIGAGLLGKSFLRLQSVSPGFDIQNLLVLRLSLPQAQYSTPETVTVFYDQLSKRLETLPEVQSVSATSVLPLSGPRDVRINFTISGRPPISLSDRPITYYRMAGPDYFRTMSIPFRSGRDFTDRDTPHSQPVAIINDSFARRYWPDESPIGAHIKIDDNNQGPREVEIIGVVGDVRHAGLKADPAPETYLPIAQIPVENVSLLTNNMNWVVRTSAEPLTTARAAQHEIQAVNWSIPTSNIKSMEQILSSSLAPSRFNLFLLGISAIAALILASMGIYAVISYSVAQRAHELGVRMALGAQRLDILKLVVGDGLKMVLIGVAIGLAVAYVLTRLLSSLLYDISVTDPSTFVSMSLLLIIVALLATYVPARRAAKVDPIVALRSE
jgi:predicted permease